MGHRGDSSGGVNPPVVMAWLEEMQAMVTVWDGVLSEKPAPSAA